MLQLFVDLQKFSIVLQHGEQFVSGEACSLAAWVASWSVLQKDCKISSSKLEFLNTCSLGKYNVALVIRTTDSRERKKLHKGQEHSHLEKPSFSRKVIA